MSNDAQLLTDILLQLQHHEFRPVYIVPTLQQRQRRAQGDVMVDDLGLISGTDNLGQAIIIRLLTPRGELAALAHPEYGSRLHELVGRPNTATTRNLVKLFILESLQAEPRIETIVSVEVQPSQVVRERADVTIRIKPIGTAERVTIGPFTLELSQ